MLGYNLSIGEGKKCLRRAKLGRQKKESKKEKLLNTSGCDYAFLFTAQKIFKCLAKLAVTVVWENIRECNVWFVSRGPFTFSLRLEL